MSESGTERVGRDVGRFLDHAYGSNDVDADGDFVVRPPGALTWVRVRSVGDDRTAVIVFSPAAIEVRVDGELTRFLATEDLNLDFAHFELHDRRRPMVVVSHSLLGEFLSREELTAAVDEVSLTAARYGPQLSERFGGWAAGGATSGGTAPARSMAETIGTLSSQTAPRGAGGQRTPAPRVQAGLTLLGLLAGFAAAFWAQSATGSWWLAAFVFFTVYFVLGPAAIEVVSRPEKVRRSLMLGLIPMTAGAALVVSYWLWDRWWLAVLVALVLGLFGGAILAARFFDDLLREPSGRDKEPDLGAFLARGPAS